MVEWPASSGPGTKMNLVSLTSVGNSASMSPKTRKPSAAHKSQLVSILCYKKPLNDWPAKETNHCLSNLNSATPTQASKASIERKFWSVTHQKSLSPSSLMKIYRKLNFDWWMGVCVVVFLLYRHQNFLHCSSFNRFETQTKWTYSWSLKINQNQNSVLGPANHCEQISEFWNTVP